jgi:hypothetical protein
VEMDDGGEVRLVAGNHSSFVDLNLHARRLLWSHEYSFSRGTTVRYPFRWSKPRNLELISVSHIPDKKEEEGARRGQGKGDHGMPAMCIACILQEYKSASLHPIPLALTIAKQ